MLHFLRFALGEVSLRPLVQGDAEALHRISDDDAVRWHTIVPPTTLQGAERGVQALIELPEVMPFAVIGPGGDFRGITSFYDYVAAVPRVEIGNTQYARAYWGTSLNPAVKLLLLTHAFETWECARVALRCDAENARSAAAIVRLGAKEEGVLRAHRRRHDGHLADTRYFSLTADQWPRAKAVLLDRVSNA